MSCPNESQIDALIRDLSLAQLAGDACNQYAPGDENNAIRRATCASICGRWRRGGQIPCS